MSTMRPHEPEGILNEKGPELGVHLSVQEECGWRGVRRIMTWDDLGSDHVGACKDLLKT